jgi:5-methylcytosine-specific restriction endonuclease McrA
MAILALDISGIPRQWISYEDAISYHATQSVAWSMGDIVVKYRGGVQRTGQKSYIECSSIIAIKGHGFNPQKHSKVTLTNRTLFGRDRMTCAYCGTVHTSSTKLSRDHILPRSRGGADTWMNVVTACRSCNSKKDNKTLKESGLELLYVPYVPNHYENIILQNRNILADQMEYLISGVPKHSRLL